MSDYGGRYNTADGMRTALELLDGERETVAAPEEHDLLDRMQYCIEAYAGEPYAGGRPKHVDYENVAAIKGIVAHEWVHGYPLDESEKQLLTEIDAHADAYLAECDRDKTVLTEDIAFSDDL